MTSWTNLYNISTTRRRKISIPSRSGLDFLVLTSLKRFHIWFVSRS